MAATAIPHLHIVILCQDYGEAMWPIARPESPIYLAAAEAGGDESLLAAAVRRSLPFTAAPIHVVTTLGMAPSIEYELARVKETKKNGVDLMVLPCNRGSAFATALACARIRLADPQAVVLTVRADQRVQVDDRWEHLIFRAYQIALQDRIVVLGSTQKDKCADYTYMRRGKEFGDTDEAYEVRLFSADATPLTARRICEQGGYWHSGSIIARAAVVLGELNVAGENSQTPDTAGSRRIADTANFMATIEPERWLAVEAKEVLDVLPAVSYEKAVLEVSRKLVVLPTTMEFSAFTSLADLKTAIPDARDRGCYVEGNGTIEKCRNTTVYAQSPERRVVAVGLKDVTIVELDDMTLVVANDRLGDLADLR